MPFFDFLTKKHPNMNLEKEKDTDKKLDVHVLTKSSVTPFFSYNIGLILKLANKLNSSSLSRIEKIEFL